jgi:hypothetical protein
MAASTGPDVNTYAIPEVDLADTFSFWRDVTNTSVYKLNKMSVYGATTSGSVSAVTDAGGTLTISLNPNITQGLTFVSPVSFSDGVTFNGAVTFNSSVVTLNANIVTIDDFNIVLGDTSGASDAAIDTAGGGGLLLRRGSAGGTAEFLWFAQPVHGTTGAWRANANIGITGPTFGIVPHSGATLPVHGTAIRLDGGSTTDHGLAISISSDAARGTTSNRAIEFSRYSLAGTTVFMEVLNGVTYGAYPFLNIRNGANRKRVFQNGHGLSFGTPVYLNPSGFYIAADSNSEDTAEVIGLVSNLVSANEFELTYIGEIFGAFGNALLTGTSLTRGSVYYLSNSAGKMSTTPARSAGTVHKAVMIATGASSGVVLPFTGGLIADTTQLASAATVSTEILQFNQFRVGDVVGFSGGSTTLSYNWTTPSPGNTSATYSSGVYVKAQANTPAAAESLGVVTEVFPIVDTSGSAVGGTATNYKFRVTTDGYFSVAGGMSADSGGLVAGTQYFLASNAAGTTQARESTTPSLVSTAPTTVGHVRKPILFATSPITGHIISYRGDVIGDLSVTGYVGTNADLTDYPVGSVLIGLTGGTLAPNATISHVYYQGSGGYTGEFTLGTGFNPAGASGKTLSGSWKSRGRAVDNRGTAGVTYYYLCQRIS